MSDTRDSRGPARNAGRPDQDARQGLVTQGLVTCAAYREEIPLVVGGDLEPPVLDLLVAHLAQCEPCAAETAAAATARDALLGGLAVGAHEWRQPELWPGVRAGLAPTPVLSFRDHALGIARRAALPLAAAAAVLLMLRPWSDGGAPADRPGVTPADSTLVQSGEADGARDGLVAEHDALFDEYERGLVPVRDEDAPVGSLPAGLGIPLNARDIEDLRREAPLRLERDDGGGLRIRRAEGTLTSFPR